VRTWEETGAAGMRRSDGQRLEKLPRRDGVELGSQLGAEGEFPNPEFGGDLPSAGRADKNGIGTRAYGFAGGIGKRRIISQPPDQGVSVQKNAQNLLPMPEFVFRQRLEKLRAQADSSLHTPGSALALGSPQRLKANQGLVVAGDDNLLALAGLIDEAREMGFRVMDLYRGHIS